MKKFTKILLMIIILLIGAAVCTVFYFRYISYPLDKDGMVWQDPAESPAESVLEAPENLSSVSAEPAEDVSEPVFISLEENPSTGFIWEYTMTPTGILEPAEDFYESDPDDSDEPTTGLGGTHYWEFRVTGSGTVELRFRCMRGDEELNDSEMIFRYECDGTTALQID